MMLGWLLARSGVDVVVLEKHADFFRDFRGDTIHPSTLEVMHELGVLDQLLAVPHTVQQRIDLDILGERVHGPDVTHLAPHAPGVVIMPQWDFLDFIKRQARQYRRFDLRMSHQVRELLYEGERIAGVIAAGPNGDVTIHADLVVAADGRHSIVRDLSGLPRTELSTPIDVLWLRVPRDPADGDQVLGKLDTGHLLVMFNRGDYWQCAFLIEKGGLAELQERGLPAFRETLRMLAPFLGERANAITSWDDVKLLSVVVDRLERWWRPGLLCIGDAAHAMSPVGGVGINLAIQDAIAAANLLWQALRERTPTEAQLLALQQLREPATRRTQALQVAFHNHILAKVVAGKGRRALFAMRWVLRHVGLLRRALGRAIGLGFRAEHVEAPATS